jgi:hypothetical protein
MIISLRGRTMRSLTEFGERLHKKTIVVVVDNRIQ